MARRRMPVAGGAGFIGSQLVEARLVPAAARNVTGHTGRVFDVAGGVRRSVNDVAAGFAREPRHTVAALPA